MSRYARLEAEPRDDGEVAVDALQERLLEMSEALSDDAEAADYLAELEADVARMRGDGDSGADVLRYLAQLVERELLSNGAYGGKAGALSFVELLLEASGFEGARS